VPEEALRLARKSWASAGCVQYGYMSARRSEVTQEGSGRFCAGGADRAASTSEKRDCVEASRLDFFFRSGVGDFAGRLWCFLSGGWRRKRDP